MRDNPLVQFIVLVLAVKAGFLLMQYLGAFLPDGGILGAVKTVLVK